MPEASWETPPPGWRDSEAEWREQAETAREHHHTTRHRGGSPFGGPAVTEERPGMQLLWDVAYAPRVCQVWIDDPDHPVEHPWRHKGRRELKVTPETQECVTLLLVAKELAEGAALHPTADIEASSAGAAADELLWVLADLPERDIEAALPDIHLRTIQMIRHLKPLAAEAAKLAGTPAPVENPREAAERERRGTALERALLLADFANEDMAKLSGSAPADSEESD